MAERTLNFPDPQVLLHFPADPHFVWHHRLLLHKIGGGRWVCLSPDLELEVVDLSANRHLVLGRASSFPAHVLPDCYIFEELTRNEYERQKRLAKTTGSILDDAGPVDVAAQVWIVSDPAASKFGQVVPSELLEDIVTLGTHGLVEWDAEVLYVKEMALDDVEVFKSERKETVGDLRTIGDHRDSQGKRYLGFKESMTLLRESKFDDWSFTGPRSVKEYLTSILSGPGDLPTYHLSWARTSGVNTSSAIVHEHRSLCQTVRLALSKDQLDVSNLCCMENVVRRLITLEIAVSRNPSAPDFSGLEVVAEAPISAHGSAQVSAMQAWVTERLKERANIAKQSRLFREETGKKPKRGDGDEESGKRWRKPKGKGKQGGAEASGAAGGQ